MENSQNYKTSFAFLISLFFMWGFITCLNDLLIPQLKEIFELSYGQAMLVQFAFFGAYFVISLIYFIISASSGDPISRMGYQNGLVLGLLICAVGCLLFYPAAEYETYVFFLGALFILASGITIIQIAANPYVAILGERATASSRLNLAQGLNSLGYTIAPVIGGILLFQGSKGAAAVKLPYLGLAVAFLLLALLFYFIKLPKFTDKQTIAKGVKALEYPYFRYGMVAIFVYVGAEVAVGSIFINYLGLEDVVGFPKENADKFLAYYWGGLMIGRFMGAISLSNIKDSNKKYGLMLLSAVICTTIIFSVSFKNWISGEHLLNFRQITPFLLLVGASFLAFIAGQSRPGRMIGIFSLAILGLVLGVMFLKGTSAMWAIIGIGLFNSVMWSNIFTLSIDGLGKHTSQGSSLLVMMIVGGALLPPIQGYLADLFGAGAGGAAEAHAVRMSFVLILVCYIYLAFYGFVGYKSGKREQAI